MRRERVDVPLFRSETSVTTVEKRPATRASESAVSDGASTTAITFLSAVKSFLAITSINRPKSSMTVDRVSALFFEEGSSRDVWDGRVRHAGNNECRVLEQTRCWRIATWQSVEITRRRASVAVKNKNDATRISAVYDQNTNEISSAAR